MLLTSPCWDHTNDGRMVWPAGGQTPREIRNNKIVAGKDERDPRTDRGVANE